MRRFGLGVVKSGVQVFKALAAHVEFRGCETAVGSRVSNDGGLVGRGMRVERSRWS